MSNENKAILITYPDAFGQGLKDLREVLVAHFSGAIGAVHILPFYPSSADRGFAPLAYSQVDEAFGTWEDIKAIAQSFPIMADFMINHLSAKSPEYIDFLQKGEKSVYKELFLRYKTFWESGEPTKAQEDAIYKRKPKAPYVEACHPDGSIEKVWSTFSDEQIDLNTKSGEGRAFIKRNLEGLARRGIAIIRLDAFAYAVKRAGGSCFFEEPEIWELLEMCQSVVEPYGAAILPEIHEHYTIQQKLALKGYATYDFALPMLLLNALYFGQTKYLKNWLEICPRKQYTTLDTHDGIGVVDVKGLLPDSEIEKTRDHLYEYGANVKRDYNSIAYNNLDIYQINCTYYSALGEDDAKYLLARAVQIFAPGIPQVYYVGLMAGRNDIALLEETKNGRDINRHGYSISEAEAEIKRPVVQKLIKLMGLRDQYAAFSGDCLITQREAHTLIITRAVEGETLSLHGNFITAGFTITLNGQPLNWQG